MNTVIPQEINKFMSIREFKELTGKTYRVKKEYYVNSPVRIFILVDGSIVVQKLSTGAIAPAKSWNEAMGMRKAALERFNAIESCFR